MAGEALVEMQGLRGPKLRVAPEQLLLVGEDPAMEEQRLSEGLDGSSVLNVLLEQADGGALIEVHREGSALNGHMHEHLIQPFIGLLLQDCKPKEELAIHKNTHNKDIDT